MSILIDMIRGILGLGAAAPKDEFGGLNPDDPEALWRADHDIDQAERAGDITAGYRLHGIKNEAHWEQVQASFFRRHGHTPEYSLAASTANFKAQLESLRNPEPGGVPYILPQGYFDPVEGVGLDRLAIAKARMEIQGPAAVVQMGLDPATLGRVEAGWSARMGAGADPTAAAMLGGLYHTYLLQARAVVSKAVAA